MGNWKSKLHEKQAESLPLIITSLLCVQILSAVRDPIVMGWNLPFWLVFLDVALISSGAGLVLWVRSGTVTSKFIYPITSFAFICAGIKVVALAVAQSKAHPFYMAIVMLGGSLCFLSIRYSVFSMATTLFAWVVVALPVLSTTEIITTIVVSLFGATLSVFVLHRRIVAVVQVLELERRVETLESILPMCASCKKTRDHTGKWQNIEEYIEDQQTGTQISHGSCPACTEKLYGDYLKNRTPSSESD